MLTCAPHQASIDFSHRKPLQCRMLKNAGISAAINTSDWCKDAPFGRSACKNIKWSGSVAGVLLLAAERSSVWAPFVRLDLCTWPFA